MAVRSKDKSLISRGSRCKGGSCLALAELTAIYRSAEGTSLLTGSEQQVGS